MSKKIDSSLKEDIKIDVRLKISALWIAMLFVFVYVDIFGFYKPGIIGGILEGKVSVFQIDQLFLLLTTLYIVIPCLMVYLTLVLKPKLNRWTNIVLAFIYIITILASCIGESWVFYIFGSIVESFLLSLLIWHAWKWET
jgi:hypothetical protein